MIQASLKRHIEALWEPRNPVLHPQAHQRARRYLVDQLRAQGRTVELQRFTTELGLEGVNILAGTERASHLLVAHYDTVDHSPGADDNGSALAVALEVAARLSDVAVLMPDLEERNLLGSRAFARTDQWRTPVALVLESVGYWSEEPRSQHLPPFVEQFFPGQYEQLAAREFRGNFWGLLCQPNLSAAATALKNCLRSDCLSFCLPQDALKLQGGEALSDFGRSDHLAFWENDRPCLMLTDSANFRNPNYHQPSDTIDTLNFKEMAKLVEDLVTWMT